MWGVPLKNIRAGEANYAELGDAPLAGYETAASLDNYPWWPDVAKFDYDGAAALVRGHVFGVSEAVPEFFRDEGEEGME